MAAGRGLRCPALLLHVAAALGVTATAPVATQTTVVATAAVLTILMMVTPAFLRLHLRN